MASILTFNTSVQSKQIAYNQSKELLASAVVRAPNIKNENTQPQQSGSVDLVAVIDRSYSMSGSPMTLVKQSLKFAINQLKIGDTFAVVTFGSDATTVMPLTQIKSKRDRQEAIEQINRIRVDGCTNLWAGMETAFRLLQHRKQQNSVSSIFVFTDGQVNTGVHNTNSLLSATKTQLRKTNGVSIFSFGFGVSHSEHLLRGISDAGQGMYYFIETQDKIATAFADCLGGITSVVAKNINLSIKLAKKFCSINRIMIDNGIQQKNSQEWTVNLGDMYKEEKRDIPLMLQIPIISAASKDTLLATLELTYTNALSNQVVTEVSTISIERPNIKDIEESDVVTVEMQELDEQKNRVIVAEALQQAGNLGASNLRKAKSFLSDALTQLESSVSSESDFTQALIRDVKNAIENMKDVQTFNNLGRKFMYSLARSHYRQRSSGISSKAAAAYLTSTKREMVSSLTGKRVEATVFASPTASSSSTSTSSNSAAVKLQVETDSKVNDIIAAANNPFATKKSNIPITKDRVKRAVKRLVNDLQEIQKNPLTNVTAQPLDEDLFEWHCCIQSPRDSIYGGIIFHIILQFPETYPFQPPTLYLCSFLKHDNVFGSWVCLDMLEEAEWSGEEANKPYTGWSSAYSVNSILLQLQSFLFDKAHTDSASISKAMKSAKQFNCKTCGHSGAGQCWPSFAATPVPKNNSKKKKQQSQQQASTALPEIACSTQRKVICLYSTKPVDNLRALLATSIQQSKKPVQSEVQVQPAQVQVPVVQAQVQPVQVPSNAKDCKKVTSVTPPPTLAELISEAEKKNGTSVTKSQRRNLSKRRARMVKAYNQQIAGVNQDQEQKEQLKPVVAAPKQETAKVTKIETAPQQEECENAIGNDITWFVVNKKKLTVVHKEVPFEVKKPKPAPVTQKEVTIANVMQPQIVNTKAVVGEVLTPKLTKSQRRNRAKAAKKKKLKAAQQSLASVELNKENKQKPVKAVVAPKSQLVQPQPQQQQQKQQQVVVVQPVQVKQPAKSLVEPTSSSSSVLNKLLSQDSSAFGNSYFSFLSDELIVKILLQLPFDDVNSNISLVCKHFRKLSGDIRLWRPLLVHYFPQKLQQLNKQKQTCLKLSAWKQFLATEVGLSREGLVCFHNKASFESDVIGIPICYKINPRTNKIQYISSTLDILSYEAYNSDQVRTSVWKQKFTNWLPLFINNNHGKKALSLLQKSISYLATKSYNKFKPDMVLEVIPKLMNTMVVSVMSGETHASVVALEGYCAFHHLLLKMIQRYPFLQAKVERIIGDFISSEYNRTKDNCPALGEWLPLLTVSKKYTWTQPAVRTAYLQENFDRNVLWTVKKYPQLRRVDNKSPGTYNNEQRCKNTFEATKTSIRLLMFHVHFLTTVARPRHITVNEVTSNYDLFYGRPSSMMKESLQQKCKKILLVSDWKQFFISIGMPPLSGIALTDWLNQSVRNSLRKKYHR